MTSYPTTQVQDEFLKAIRQSQETVLQAIRTWADTAQSMTPKMPAAQLPTSCPTRRRSWPAPTTSLRSC